MPKISKMIIAALICITAMAIFSGCTQPENEKKVYQPHEVVTTFWYDLDTGKYMDAYELVYHQDNISVEDWADSHEVIWGMNGSNIYIHKFNVIGNNTITENIFEGNFTEMRAITVNATVSYMGQNSSGITQFVVVKTPDGWKLLGNY
jgi:hypothetical protein